MGAGGSSASKPLASLFGADEEGKRGPTLGSALVPGAEPGSWRLLLVAPLRIQIFDAQSAKSIELEDILEMREHVPFTACATSLCDDDCTLPDAAAAAAAAAAGGEGAAEGLCPLLAVGCQDGAVLVFEVKNGVVVGPVHTLRASLAAELPEGGEGGAAGADLDLETQSTMSLALSITVLRFNGRDSLYAGSIGRCMYWDLRTGQLQRQFSLPVGPDNNPSVPSTMCSIPQRVDDADGGATGVCLWVGMDTGSIAVFDIDTGMLIRSFSCAGPEALVSLAHFPGNDVVFALSAHRRVSVWDANTYGCIQKYPAELMTCGADLSAMIAIKVRDPDLSLLMLAGVDGSLCVRRVSRRPDGKLNCVLLSFFECLSADGAPITLLGYHEPTDSVVLGDAGCAAAILSKLKDQLGTSVQAQSEQRAGRGEPPSTPSTPMTHASMTPPPTGARPSPAASSPVADALTTAANTPAPSPGLTPPMPVGSSPGEADQEELAAAAGGEVSPSHGPVFMGL
mmetsp:Transcript_123140/g.394352  ORF Transcript_123140/g.394352 Transcript_123140/m.394352 type:complete len:510 (-) Transcript_123140:205-1734(-)